MADSSNEIAAADREAATAAPEPRAPRRSGKAAAPRSRSSERDEGGGRWRED